MFIHLYEGFNALETNETTLYLLHHYAGSAEKTFLLEFQLFQNFEKICFLFLIVTKRTIKK